MRTFVASPRSLNRFTSAMFTNRWLPTLDALNAGSALPPVTSASAPSVSMYSNARLAPVPGMALPNFLPSPSTFE